MNELVDTHLHLESFVKRGELDGVLERAREAGVERMIAVGTSREDWGLYRGLAEGRRGKVFYTVGLHPCSVVEGWREEIAAMGGFWEEGLRPVAVGEIGLDRFHLPKDDEAAAGRIFGWQKEAFAEGLRFAKEVEAPVVVHSRGAFRECVEMIDASGVDWRKVVFHCFVEGAPEMRELMERGGRGSFTGVVTYKSAEVVREALREQGLGRLMLETDAPYLAPVPHRGKGNEPAFLRNTAEFAAGVLGVSVEVLARETTRVAEEFFGLG